MKQKIIDWYNAHIVAGWYASASLIGGWLVTGIAWLPDLINFAIDHFDFFGRFVLPTMNAETKAVAISFYVAFIAPALRAKVQNWMQRKALKQAAEQGKVIPLASSGVAPVALSDTPTDKPGV